MQIKEKQAEFVFFDQKPEPVDIISDIQHSLSQEQKFIAPKYFYDEKGSELFEKITHLPEYYLTRAEISILENNREEIAEHIEEHSCIVEYGSGNSTKIRILLEALNPRAYVPVDISADHLIVSAQAIFKDYADLHVYPICADYTRYFTLPAEVENLDRIAFFPGSSLGNFSREGARNFLIEVRKSIGEDGLFILGVDTRKPKDVVERAYNDSQEVTAAFNLNILAHLNHRIGSNFDIDCFQHQAIYDVHAGRIEMYLVSKCNQSIQIGDRTIDIARGERIHTENSHKYSREELENVTASAGMPCEQIWSDEDERFMVALLRSSSAQ